MLQVIKRSGRRENFNPDKVQKAVHKCLVQFDANTSHETSAAIANKVLSKLPATIAVPIEKIQDTVEAVLEESGLQDHAEAYRSYRLFKAKQRQVVPIDAETQALFDSNKQYFKTPLQLFQYYDKYARWIPEKKRRETWPETVERVMRFLKKNCKTDFTEAEWGEMKSAMLHLQVMPSMRCVQMSGPALERDHVGAYNCAALAIDSLDAFAELLYILMQGTGCSFSVEDRFVSKLPKVKKQKRFPKKEYAIPDSTEGWCDALKYGLNNWFDGRDVSFDCSKIRPEGAPLKTKGGVASGLQPLKDLLDFARKTVLAAQGRRLTTLECHDIACYCGWIVQVGGVRRAAELSLSDLDDKELAECKPAGFDKKTPWRAMSNNSATFEEKPTATEFMEEWLNLAKSGTGERGIFNRNCSIPSRRKRAEFLVNPCQPGFATVIGPNGIQTFDDTLVGSIIWSGTQWATVTAKVCTGEKDVFRFMANGGSFLGTAEHEVISGSVRVQACEAETLTLSQGKIPKKLSWNALDVIDGLVIGDGMQHKASNGKVVLLIGAKDGDYFLDKSLMPFIRKKSAISKYSYEVSTTVTASELPRKPYISIPERFKFAAPATVLGFLRGLYSANGSVCGERVTLKSASKALIHDVQEMLSSVGIRSYYTSNKPSTVVFSNGTYTCKKSWDLNISIDRCIFRDLIGFVQQYKTERLEEICKDYVPRESQKTEYDITDIEYLGRFQVYDITVDSPEHIYWTGGVLVSNCSEIILRDCEFCNLSICVARPDDTFDDLVRKVRIATMFGTAQCTLTYFPYLNPSWEKNCSEERLLGVDITGQRDCRLLQTGNREFIFASLLDTAVETNEQLAKRFGIPQSAAVTCIKPSGNCRPWYSLTTTTRGLLTLQELMEHHSDTQKWSPIEGTGAIQDADFSPIRASYDNGITKTLRVVMNYGMVVESTPEHRWFVTFRHDRRKHIHRTAINDFIATKYLKPGDVLGVQLGTYNNTQHSTLHKVNTMSIKMAGSAVIINQPLEMNEDIAWFLGYLWGDGAMSAGGFRLRFSDENVWNLEKAQRIFYEQFGLQSTIACKDKRKKTLEVASIHLWHWLIRNDIFKYFAGDIDRIPRVVRSSTKEDIIAFLAGLLDSDGWAGHTKVQSGRFAFTTASESFAQHIQDVCWSVGLGVGRSLNSIGKNFQKRRRMFLLAGSVNMLPESFNVLRRNSNKAIRAEKRQGFKAWEWESGTRNGNIVGKIVSIENGPEVYTGDVETENGWFYAGSMKSHNSAQLLDCSSGVHVRYAPYYIRRVRTGTPTAIAKLLKDSGVPWQPEVGHDPVSPTVLVFEFPVKSPDGTVCRNDVTAKEQFMYWLDNRVHYTEHSVSCTIYVEDHEWLELGTLVYANWDKISGLSFLPKSDHAYRLAPYEEIDVIEYEKRVKNFPDINWAKIVRYENSDQTTNALDYSCVSGACEL